MSIWLWILLIVVVLGVLWLLARFRGNSRGSNGSGFFESIGDCFGGDGGSSGDGGGD